jgi:hypothetical protein
MKAHYWREGVSRECDHDVERTIRSGIYASRDAVTLTAVSRHGINLVFIRLESLGGCRTACLRTRAPMHRVRTKK